MPGLVLHNTELLTQLYTSRVFSHVVCSFIISRLCVPEVSDSTLEVKERHSSSYSWARNTPKPHSIHRGGLSDECTDHYCPTLQFPSPFCNFTALMFWFIPTASCSQSHFQLQQATGFSQLDANYSQNCCDPKNSVPKTCVCVCMWTDVWVFTVWRANSIYMNNSTF